MLFNFAVIVLFLISSSVKCAESSEEEQDEETFDTATNTDRDSPRNTPSSQKYYSELKLFDTLFCSAPDTKSLLSNTWNTESLDIKNVYFFVPYSDFRADHDVYMIHAIGPLLKMNENVDVVPVYLVVGRIMFFYRDIRDHCWLPALQYGSTVDQLPFIDNAVELSDNNERYGRLFANSHTLEKVAWEIHAIDLAGKFPCTGNSSSWKVLFAIYGLKSLEPGIDSQIELQFDPEVLPSYQIRISYNQLEDTLFIPHRDPESLYVSARNTFNRTISFFVLPETITGPQASIPTQSQPLTNRGIIKGGSARQCFPEVLTWNIRQAIAFVNGLSVDRVNIERCRGSISAFQSFFKEYLEFMMNPLQRKPDRPYSIIAGRFNGDDIVMPNKTLPEFEICLNCKVTNWNSSVDRSDAHYFGIQRHPLIDIVPFLQCAELLLQEENPIAAAMMIAKAVHRMSLVIFDSIKGPYWMQKSNHAIQTNHMASLGSIEKKVQEMLGFHIDRCSLKCHHIFRAFIRYSQSMPK